MAYHTDHSRPDGLHSHGRFTPHRDAPQGSDSTWVIGGLVALVLIIGGLFMFGQRGELNSPNPSATGTTQSAPASRPAAPALPAR
jgi:hypothetical protein